MKHSIFLLFVLSFTFPLLAQKKKPTGYGHLDFTLATSKAVKQYTAITAGAGFSPDGFASIGLGIDAFVLQKKYKATIVPHGEFSYFISGLHKSATPFIMLEPGVSITEGVDQKTFSGSVLLGFMARNGKDPGPFATFGFSRLQKQNFLRLSLGLCF